MTMIDWQSLFDKIYCVHYFKQKERLPRISAELKRVGILDSGVFDWFYDYDSPFFYKLQEAIFAEQKSDILNSNSFTYFKCSFTHYRIWKEICAREFKRALIVEDDEVFLKDLDFIQKLYEESREFDLCLFDKAPFSSSLLYQQALARSDERYPREFRDFDASLNLCSSGNYSMSLKCAQIYAKAYEEKVSASDALWRDDQLSKKLFKAFSVVNASYQLPYRSCLTTHDNWDLAYSWCGLDKSLYQEY